MEKNAEKKVSAKSTKSNVLWAFWLAALFLAVFWWNYPLLFTAFFAAHNPSTTVGLDKLGQFGDSFGALNALFAGLAFVGVAVSVWVQRQELEVTREQYEIQRKQLQEEKTQQHIQAFENTFFLLLQAFKQIIDSAKFAQSEGYAAYKAILEKFNNTLSNGSQIKDSIREYERVYEQYYDEVLGHFFRHFYHILKYVDASDIPHKKFYTSLLRAQLSSSQIFLIYLNGRSKFGREKLKPLIEKYAVLEQLSESDFNDTIGLSIDNALDYNLDAFGDAPWLSKIKKN